MSELSFKRFDKFQNAFIMVPLSAPAIKYFTKEYGKEIPGGRKDSFLGPVIDMAAEKKPYRKYKLRKRTPGQKVTILIPSRIKHAKIDETGIGYISMAMENGFMESFVKYVDGAVDCGSSETNAINTFLSKYNIEVEEWENNAARMQYRRLKGYREPVKQK